MKFLFICIAYRQRGIKDFFLYFHDTQILGYSTAKYFCRSCLISRHLLFFLFFLSFFPLCAIFSWEESQRSGKAKTGKVFKRITGRLCQTTQDKEITFTNPTLWCPLHKMSLSSAIIEHWADYYCAKVISYALSIVTFKVSCLAALS